LQCRALILTLALPSFLPTTFGTTQGGLNAGGGGPHPPTALQALSRPPVATLPVSDASLSVPLKMAVLICAAVNDGCAAFTSAAAPATCGVAIEVPLIVL
jgi:hypothetical protein